MTCGKCERLIKEALHENISEVQEVKVFREEGYANVLLKEPTSSQETLETHIKSQILDTIHGLVNGKFKAIFAAGKFTFIQLQGTIGHRVNIRKTLIKVTITLSTFI